MEWSIQQVGQIAGVTSRTLRHYDDIGLVTPSRVGNNGYRHYDEKALVRLQRVLLLRQLGLRLSQIADVLEREVDEASVLMTHLSVLRQEQNRLTRQVAAVEHTIRSLKRKETLMAETMFDGFNHTQYKDEVEERWGADSYAKSDAWWQGKTENEKADWTARMKSLNRDWIAAASDPEVAADSERAQTLAARHVDWLRSIPGTPAADPNGDLDGYVKGLAEMYVCDERFAANYGGVEGASFVRDALVAYLT
ncbi:TipAS antibiotic-recognition domain-containing protein [Actinomycetaceae bacterium MB13-C1-2]|nr:TipAS antibiotic-recognition domain-containing protein [Actinomycetaceae bacterium MB13-C1-2]